jgi:hypothetical protein
MPPMTPMVGNTMSDSMPACSYQAYCDHPLKAFNTGAPANPIMALLFIGILPAGILVLHVVEVLYGCRSRHSSTVTSVTDIFP